MPEPLQSLGGERPEAWPNSKSNSIIPLLHSHLQRDIGVSQESGGVRSCDLLRVKRLLMTEAELEPYFHSLCGPSISPNSSVTQETLRKG